MASCEITPVTIAEAFRLRYIVPRRAAERAARAALAKYRAGGGLKWAYVFELAAERLQLAEHREACARRAFPDAHE